MGAAGASRLGGTVHFVWFMPGPAENAIAFLVIISLIAGVLYV